MPGIKQEIIRMIETLPEEIDYDEIMAKIYFKQKLDNSLKQIEEGRIVSHKEAKKRISKWIK
ncbi:MAG: hypothetical protein AB1630_01540 [bacterium]